FTPRKGLAWLALVVFAALGLRLLAAGGRTVPGLVRSARSGPWSAPATWEGGKVPGAGARVQIGEDHRVVYDGTSGPAAGAVRAGGPLPFARARHPLRGVGLIPAQPGEPFSEDGFDCDPPARVPPPGAARPALEVGTREQPPDAKHTATIRLKYFAGL